jgi:hypothetical protein
MLIRAPIFFHLAAIRETAAPFSPRRVNPSLSRIWTKDWGSSSSENRCDTPRSRRSLISLVKFLELPQAQLRPGPRLLTNNAMDSIQSVSLVQTRTFHPEPCVAIPIPLYRSTRDKPFRTVRITCRGRGSRFLLLTLPSFWRVQRASPASRMPFG